MKATSEDPELYKKAVVAYERYCRKDEYVYQQPSHDDSVIGTKFVHLKNVNGNLQISSMKDLPKEKS